MKIRKKIKKFFYERGFTLLEILIVIAIMAIISSIIVPQVIQAKEKAYNANVRQVLAALRPASLNQFLEVTPNSYSPVCGGGPVDLALNALGGQQGVSTTDYQCTATPDKWTAIFPLKGANGYWCTDSDGTSVEVVGFLANPPTVIDCAHATVIPGSVVVPPPPPPPSNTIPTITLDGPDTQEFYTKVGNPFAPGQHDTDKRWCDPGFTASDVEDGNITNQATITGPTLISSTSGSCKIYTYKVYYNVTDSNGTGAVTKVRTLIHHKCEGHPIPCPEEYQNDD